MAKDNITKLRDEMRKVQDPKRFEHTLGVTYTSACLAMCYNENIQDAEIAGLLHDCAKCLSDEKRLDICHKQKITVTDIENRHPHLLHGKVGAYLAKKKYDITDPQILHAIAVHTTGCPDMNLLDKIIYIADYIEPHRDKAPHLEDIRRKSFADIDAGLFMILEDSVQYLSQSPSDMDPMTLETYEYYKNLQK